MDEIEAYRTKINSKYYTRRNGMRYSEGGRRKTDYKLAPIITFGIVLEIVSFLVIGLITLLTIGCTYLRGVCLI